MRKIWDFGMTMVASKDKQASIPTVVFLAFVRSGYVNLNNGQARNVGNEGDYWSRTAKSSTNAYNLNFNTSNVNPSNNNNRWNGFPLR